MPLGEYAHKFDAHALFCHYMVEHWDTLLIACDGDPVCFKTCVVRFDEALGRLFDTKVKDIAEATDLMTRNLQAAADDIKTSNSAAATALGLVITDACNNHSTWTHSKGLEICHDQGRELGLLFFQASTWPGTKARLNRRAVLEYQFGRSHTAQLLRVLHQQDPSPQVDVLIQRAIDREVRETKENYTGLPGSPYTFQGQTSQDYSISIPFTRANNLMLYLSYPFLFMHEYTAHIFSTDELNDRFNDGWMLYAISEYLAKNWVWDSRMSFLKNDQAYAFKRFLLGKLDDEARDNHDSAEEIDYFLLPWDKDGRFEQFTYELADYIPGPGQLPTWPTSVLKKLTADLKDPNRLKREMQLSPSLSLRALYPHLK